MIDERERRAFERRATQGHVVDKDATMHVLDEVRLLYRNFGMSGRQSREVTAPHEERLLGGKAEEQFETSQVIFDVHAKLQMANASRERVRAQRGSR